MKIACIQMDVRLGRPDENFARAQEQIRRAAACGADTVLLPEVWNTGFFPKEGLEQLADAGAQRTKAMLRDLSRELGVCIVGGSVAEFRSGAVRNTAYVFGADGREAARYEKTHLFTPMGEDRYFRAGDAVCVFALGGVRCGVVICYDLRFPELIRTLALQGIELLFVPAQWPAARLPHWQTLTRARAIENQLFVACCNGCGAAGETRFGGGSAIYDPWGNALAAAQGEETTIFADCDFSAVAEIRGSIDVFRDRRPELYRI